MSEPISPASKSDSLPSTVDVLELEDGRTLYLLGTAHVSLQSVEDVERTIQRIEQQVRDAHPDVKRIFVEAQSRWDFAREKRERTEESQDH